LAQAILAQTIRPRIILLCLPDEDSKLASMYAG